MGYYSEKLNQLKPYIEQRMQEIKKEFLDCLYSKEAVLSTNALIEKHFVDCYTGYHNELDKLVNDCCMEIEHHYIRELTKFSVRHYMSKFSLSYPIIEKEYFSKTLIKE